MKLFLNDPVRGPSTIQCLRMRTAGQDNCQQSFFVVVQQFCLHSSAIPQHARTLQSPSVPISICKPLCSWRQAVHNCTFMIHLISTLPNFLPENWTATSISAIFFPCWTCTMVVGVSCKTILYGIIFLDFPLFFFRSTINTSRAPLRVTFINI